MQTEEIFNSKIRHFIWRLHILQELDTLVSRKPTYLAKRGIKNLVGLLQKMGLRDSRLAQIAFAVRDIHPVNKEKLADIFDDSHAKRGKLEKEIDSKRKEVRIFGSQEKGTLAEWLEIKQPRLLELKEELRVLEGAVNLLPKRNTVDPSVWAYPTDVQLQKKDFMTPMPNSSTNTFLCTKKTLCLLDQKKSGYKLVSDDLDGLPEEVLLRQWSEFKTILKGHIPDRSVIERALGIVKRVLTKPVERPMPPKGWIDGAAPGIGLEPLYFCSGCHASKDLYIDGVTQSFYCRKCAEELGIIDQLARVRSPEEMKKLRPTRRRRT